MLASSVPRAAVVNVVAVTGPLALAVSPVAVVVVVPTVPAPAPR